MSDIIQEVTPNFYYTEQLLKINSKIKIGNDLYRVIGTGENQPLVKLMKLESTTSSAYRTPGDWDVKSYSFDGESQTGHFTYYHLSSDSENVTTVDKAIENGWYDTIQDPFMKSNISNIQLGVQEAYKITVSEVPSEVSNLVLRIKLSDNTYQYVYKISTLGTTFTRHAFAPTIRDIVDCLGNDITDVQLAAWVEDKTGSDNILLIDTVDYGHFDPADDGLGLGIDVYDKAEGKAKLVSSYTGKAKPVFWINLRNFRDWETIPE